MSSISFSALLASWDRQQSAYIAEREARFNAQLEVLALSAGQEFHVIDLACGPGSLSLRILRRFPQARVTALDLDPVLLAVARGALVEYGDRIRIIQADLADPDCFSALSGPAPQAAVSSTALHWLMPEQQLGLYRRVAALLADGGVFLNADHQRYDRRHPRLKALAERHDEQTQEQAWRNGVDDWDRWFATALQLPELAQHQAQRESLFAGRPVPPATPLDFQIAGLTQAGFTEAGPVWQLLDDYVIAGWK
ncbi:class I SAM-dependent methyltransferase [Serratia entomophila]|uniref:class I SAM-dependent methyltransferase n=1 Tax=Serratia entomophila TaxID=42906 RepID=UPI00217B9AF1|nr:class I SAM-dependent methyltransferase [Serratia entomophila]CAI0806883.1 Trans-aconitate 2-methyltransferase [Serratia entomophila]CAI1554607.1 Trans-aconitate 2-methyltransferase [Serratia entomophila]CAI1563385.1 Trans-aconitate 2-methyltransferase [Serratia entomophila]CAI1621410.1 Trans-aconitate 2-methyltransferase [Serratia entomophila]CAI1677445.1 Trans-aconitate 2-methyltransferase [Serratia entomophila]